MALLYFWPLNSSARLSNKKGIKPKLHQLANQPTGEWQKEEEEEEWKAWHNNRNNNNYDNNNNEQNKPARTKDNNEMNHTTKWKPGKSRYMKKDASKMKEEIEMLMEKQQKPNNPSNT